MVLFTKRSKCVPIIWAYNQFRGKQECLIIPHGKTCGFPLNNKTYEVDLLIGMSFAFRKELSIPYSSQLISKVMA
jgi:hypothetical protein